MTVIESRTRKRGPALCPYIELFAAEIVDNGGRQLSQTPETKCICPSCGRAYDDTGPRNATEYTRLDRVVRLCRECYQIPGNIRDRVMALRCKILEGKPFTATDRKWIEKTKGVGKWLYRQ